VLKRFACLYKAKNTIFNFLFFFHILSWRQTVRLFLDNSKSNNGGFNVEAASWLPEKLLIGCYTTSHVKFFMASMALLLPKRKEHGAKK
jgi:hypothetical protein